MTREEYIKYSERLINTEQPPLIISYDSYVQFLMDMRGITKEEAQKLADKEAKVK